MTAPARLKRATRLFVFEERAAESPFVQSIWRTRGHPADAFTSVAETHWEMVVTRQNGRASLSVLGPETRASTAAIPRNAEFLGIQFRLGTFMPGLRLAADSGRSLPPVGRDCFWLEGAAWELPAFHNVETFVRRLVREGLLVRDPVVEAALRDRTGSLSQRSVQRRVLQATGLTRALIAQVERAKVALALLEQGVPILDTVERAGYADQSHLTRALQRFIGDTPARVIAAGRR